MKTIGFTKIMVLVAVFLSSSLLSFNSWAVNACGSGGYANLKEFSSSSATFSVEWGLCGANEIEMKMTGNGTGWIGVGFSEDASMSSTDVVIAGVDPEGNSYLVDTWASERTSPTIDTTQNYILVSANEVAGSTSIEFTRALNTGDLDDYALDGVARYLLWAMGEGDYAGNGSDYHGSARGISSGVIDFSTSPVPLPAGLPLLLTGLGFLGLVKRKA